MLNQLRATLRNETSIIMLASDMTGSGAEAVERVRAAFLADSSADLPYVARLESAWMMTAMQAERMPSDLLVRLLALTEHLERHVAKTPKGCARRGRNSCMNLRRT